MSQPLRRRGRPRKRNKSSPSIPSKQIHKKHRVNEFESSYSEIDSFFEIESDTSMNRAESPEAFEPLPASSTPVPTKSKPISASFPPKSTMLQLSDNDIEKLSECLSGKLKAPLAKDLKQQLATELKGQIVSEIKTELKSLVDAQLQIATKPLTDQINALQLENKSLKAEIQEIHSETNTIKNDNVKLFADLDELDQYGRRMCLDIFNIPGDTGDNSEDVEQRLLSLASTVKLDHDQPLDITAADIDKCHRLGVYRVDTPKNRRIIIKFTNSKARQRLWNARKRLGDGIFVAENITRYRENLSYQARELTRGLNPKLARTWVAGGRIYGMMSNTQKKVIIKNTNDIQLIKAGTSPTTTPPMPPTPPTPMG